jgi:predicted anti-sigma-YlaC factor YlaD
MVTCGSCRPQLLDYLYDLLEGDEQQAVQDHLALCSDCQAALVSARTQQKVLASAARLDFSSVRFQAPVNNNHVAERNPQTIPLRVPSPVPWKRWALAATVLIALAGAGVPAGWFWHDYSSASHIVKDYKQMLARAQEDVGNAEGETRKAAAHYQERLAAASQRQFNVRVTGPATVQPGAPNLYTIETRNIQNQMVPTRLTVRVRDEKVIK